jgi:predicted 2-oxoglutarate/Fe(II)-dependent dioxygenase YbiX
MTTSTIPPLDLQHLAEHGFVVAENFLSNELYESLRSDVHELRKSGKFQVAKIGHDGMVQDENTPFKDIRYSETCFIGKMADGELNCSKARSHLYDIMDNLKRELATNEIIQQGPLTKSIPALDNDTEELMYAYYPKGGYYRRHRDAEPGSVSNWRKYSLLLYLNDKDWTQQDGGQLRIHRDSGDDELPAGELPNFIDVKPTAGTLGLFRSDLCPHEVLDTRRERVAIVGWFLSQEPTCPTTEAKEVELECPVTKINSDTLQALRTLRDNNPGLKARLEPPLTTSSSPLSIWGDDYVLPGAVATPARASANQNPFQDTDARYWKKIATFDTSGNINTLSLSSVRLRQAAGLVPPLIQHVVTLDLANSNLPVTELAAVLKCVAEGSASASLHQLRLGGNCLTHDDLQTILDPSPSFLSTLSSLDLRYNPLGPDGASFLAKWLHERESKCIQVLYLEGTKLGDRGAAAIAKVETLDEVYLGSNGIGPDGAAALAVTAVKSWRRLFLEGNHIGSEGASFFVEALQTASGCKTKTLERLYADNNGMSKEVNILLGNALGSATLIGDGGIFQ